MDLLRRLFGNTQSSSRDDRFDHLSKKAYGEIKWWEREVSQIVSWYRGDIERLYESPAPSDEEKVTRYDDETRNALMTWVNRDARKYLEALHLPPDAFVGRRVLDVGCGPVPYMAAFKGCDLVGLDQLIAEYELLGFPLYDYDDRIEYVTGVAEAMPLPDDAVDVVISVNAIDHVTDVPQTAREIRRVLKPEGRLRMQVHYHEATSLEPWELDDDTILEYFGDLDVEKIHEEMYPGRPDEQLVVWGNG